MTEETTKDGPKFQEGGWWQRHTAVATRLAIAVLAASIVSLVGFLAVAVAGSGQDGQDLLHGRLITTAGDRAAELTAYVERVETELTALGLTRTFIDGAQEFDAAYDDLAKLDLDDLREERTDLTVFYVDEYLPILEEVRGGSVDLAEITDGLDSAAVYLQSAYIARNPLPIDEKRLFTDAEDGSSWTDVHKEYHPILRADADRLGFAELYLIEPETLSIVYSTNKDVDFGTSLDSGPYSGTALAELVVRTLATGEPGSLGGVDFTSFGPRFDAPTAFMATPLVDGDRVVGVLAGSLSSDVIDTIMTTDWVQGRFGETGDVYLVGEDARMRSTSRGFIEDPDLYLATVKEMDVATSEERNQMASLDTTVLFQNVDGEGVRAALRGEQGLISDTSYLGEEVYTAYQPLDSELFHWAILAEQQRIEVDAALNSYVLDNIALVTVLIVVLTFFAVAWASYFMGPIRRISAALANIRQDHEGKLVPSAGAREFRVLSDHLNAMVTSLSGRKHAVSDALEKKVGILRTLLPVAIADAVIDGETTLVETIPHASIVVFVVDGLAELFRTRDTEANRTLMNSIVDAADELAADNGLERIKVMGDTYYAVCGTNIPYLDHAPRTVRFTQQIRNELLRAAREDSVALDLTAGIQTGSVTVGLIGDSRLVYDVWGDAVDQAYDLARTGGRGEILVTGTVRDRLPEETALVPFRSGETSAWAVVDAEADQGAES